MNGETLALVLPKFPHLERQNFGGMDAGQKPSTAIRNSFEFVSADELGQREPPRWLVQGLLPVGGIGVVMGRPGDGKTFFALDLCLSISQGVDFHGFRTRGGAT